MLLAAARRFVVLFGSVVVATALVSMALGALLGGSSLRAIALGFYGVGSFLLLGGFFIGNRGPIRLKSDSVASFLERRAVRWATADEQEDALNSSGLFVTLGLVLILMGLAVDPAHSFL
jgi:hypothetical protein